MDKHLKFPVYIYLFFFLLFIPGILHSQVIPVKNIPFHSEDYKVVSAHLSYDGKHFVFIAQNEDGNKLLECTHNAGGQWSSPVSVNAVNEFDSIDFTIESPAYNHDASVIYFSLKYDRKDASADIWSTSKKNGEWTKPELFSSSVNSDIDESDPFISADGKYFYFARKFEDSEMKKFDCYQIFVSEFKDGSWQSPVLLPEPLNDGCDRSPRISPDGKTLYFSSVRDDGKTGFDLYYAKKITKNAWMSPVLIDTVNNTMTEYFPSPAHPGDRLYYLRSSGAGKKDSTHLVYANLDIQFQSEKSVRLYGTVKDLNSGHPLLAQIHVTDPNTSIIQSVSETDQTTGAYSLFLPKDRKFRIDVFNKRYSHNFFTYNTLKLSDFNEVNKDFELYSEVDLILNIYDSEIFEPLDAIISLYDNETGEVLNVEEKEIEKGMYSLSLPIGKVYRIEAENKHFETDSFKLDLSGVVQFSEFERDMELEVRKVDYVFNITDEETGEGVEAIVEIINLSTNEKIIKKVKTDKEGKLKIKLRDGTQYEINITPQGYAFYNTTVDLVEEETNYITEAKLTPLRKETKLELNHIYFETNSADLNKESFKELDRVVNLLINNPQIKIEISAHTDDIGSAAYNLKLSDRRANSVKEYLFGKDISEEQIISKGYGESKPAYLPFNIDENRAKNRRVELEVIDIKE